jgi:hypothetical protein
MKIEIEKYRGWTIYFDPSNEDFYTLSDEYDHQKTKKSFAAVKKYIDDFIKENQTFVPVIVEKPSSTWSPAHRIKLIGIRKDNRFIYEDEDGSQKQLSEYNEKDYIMVNPLNDPIYERISVLKTDRDRISKEISDAEKQIIKVGLSGIKEKYKTN